jgi:hypothetical protein
MLTVATGTIMSLCPWLLLHGHIQIKTDVKIAYVLYFFIFYICIER